MKPLQLFAVLVTLLVCLAGLSWLARWMPARDTRSEAEKALIEALREQQSNPPPEDPDKDHYEANPFKPATGTDLPQAELVETTFEFGRMGLGKVGKHDFMVKNTGKAPLKIARGPTQCKCTVTGLKDQEIPPGGEAAIHLSWEPKADGPFAQTATIWTNDPQHMELKIGVEGTMFKEMDVQPSEGWNLGNLTTSNPTPFSGMIRSPIFKEFQITKVEPSSDRVKVEVVPLTEEELSGPDFNMLSGYRLQGELAGVSEPGKTEERVTVFTDIPDYPKFEFPIKASRIGAITIIGPNWIAGGPLLDLGTVSAEAGKEFKLTVMVPPGNEEFKFTNVVSDPGFLKLRLVPEKVGKELSRERYSLYVAVPPHSPKGVWGSGNPGKIMVKTNHPQIEEMEIKVYLDLR